MSSWVRRIERQVAPSQLVLLNAKEIKTDPKAKRRIGRNPPREVFYCGRGSRIGVRNPTDAARVARERREAKRKEAKD